VTLTAFGHTQNTLIVSSSWVPGESPVLRGAPCAPPHFRATRATMNGAATATLAIWNRSGLGVHRIRRTERRHLWRRFAGTVPEAVDSPLPEVHKPRMANEFDIIGRRRSVISEQRKRAVADMERAEGVILACDAEREELDRAEALLKRIAAKDEAPAEPTAPSQFSASEPPRAPSRAIPKKGGSRPEGTPTTPDMIDTLLAEAEAEGKRGLRGRDLVRGIASRWWPDVGWDNVLPEAQRLCKRGVLARESDLYVRAKIHEARLRELELRFASPLPVAENETEDA
jgi:hypothetical protein